MYKDLLCQTTLLDLPLAAMFVFLAVFITVVVRTMATRAHEYSSAAALPLVEEESSHERR